MEESNKKVNSNETGSAIKQDTNNNNNVNSSNCQGKRTFEVYDTRTRKVIISQC